MSASTAVAKADIGERRLGGPRTIRGGQTRRWLGGLALVGLAALGCSSSPPATRTAAQPKSTFAQNLSLAMSLSNAPAVGDTSVTATFTLTNNGSASFDGCFGPSWGVSVIVGDHDAGHIVRAEHPRCDEKFALLPAQKIVWSKKVPLGMLRAGVAKVTAWVKLVDPATCDPSRSCREVSVATRLMSVSIGER